MTSAATATTDAARDAPVLFERDGKIAVITLNRPAEGNRWRREMLYAFEPVVEALHRDEETRVVIVRGAGEEYFSWGAFDPAIRGAMDKQEIVDFVLRGARLRDSLEMLPQIVIAALNGKARGNGVELSLACDMRFVSERATISFPEADMGGIPGGGGPARLPSVVGRARALELLCSGREVGAEEMVRIGFALAAYPHERLMEEVMAFARNIAEKGPIALRGAKRVAHTRLAPGLREARQLSDEIRSRLEWSHDVDEAIAAHREGRKPRFTGK
ncbi:MAG: enoyl-CoA hydratase/isomerase family protein [Betaproteobacteria bacterium]|nr:enoyl-CoA hydratase/isomerase family protein [Betaproteobacteria bacterium]